MPALIRTARRRLRTLGADRSGLALLEFAFTLPIVLTLGGFGIDCSFLALTNLRVSQFALTLADNASRVGIAGTGGVTQLREADINDALQGTRLEGQGVNLTTNGRVTVSSLENIQQSYDTQPVQRIHWQRCMGMMSGTGYDSTYGTTTTAAGSDATQANAGTAVPAGMGDTGRKVNAISGSGVMFVEVNYQYRPAFGGMFLGSQIVHYSASFLVRDNRDFTHVYNPAPASTASTCDKHNS